MFPVLRFDYILFILPDEIFQKNCISGTCNKRREAIEEELNTTWQEFMDQEFRISEAYSHMVDSKPSKVLSGWTYQGSPKPLRSPRTAGEFRETEVSFNIQKNFYITFTLNQYFLCFNCY